MRSHHQDWSRGGGAGRCPDRGDRKCSEEGESIEGPEVGGVGKVERESWTCELGSPRTGGCGSL